MPHYIHLGALATVLLVCGATGCVSTRTFEEAQQRAYARHQEDQRQILDLTVSNKRLTQRIDELEASLQSAREQAARTEKEWKEARDELLKLKIEKEQAPGRRRDRAGQDRPPSESGDDQLRLRERIEEAKRRVKEVLQQLQGMLDQF